MDRAARFAFWLSLALVARAQGPSKPDPDPVLVEAQSLIDIGRFADAEATVRQYLSTHQASADAHYLLAYALFREGNPKASLAEYTEAGRYREPGGLDLAVIGNNYFLLEDYTSADRWLTRAVALSPHDPQARYYLGRSKYNQKHFSEAAEAFSVCLKLDSGNVQAAEYLGLSDEALGRTEEALTAYRSAIAMQAGSDHRISGPSLDIGNLLVEADRTAEAIPFLLQAAEIAPGDWQIHRALGKAYLELNRLAEAKMELRKALDIAPDNGPLHFLMAQAFRKSGLSDEALAENQQYLALTGSHSSPDSPLAEARALMESGKVVEAEQTTRRFLELHKSSADGHYLLGYILFKKQEAKSSLAEYTEAARYRQPSAADLEAVAGDYVLLKDYPDADKWFTKAVQWNPQDSLGWYYLGRTKYNENRFDEAVSAFEQCLKLDPRNVKAEDNLGLSLEGLNQTDKAIAAYRTAIEWQKDAAEKNAGPPLDLGSLLVDSNRAADALPYLLDAVRLAPADYRVHRQLGKAYAHLNRLGEARSELEKAVALAPRNAPVHFMLAQVYRRQGLADKARIESEAYTALAGENETHD